MHMLPWSSILRIARLFARDEDAAQDLAQEAWIRAWRVGESILPGREAAWIRQVARNRAINQTRDAARRRHLLAAHGEALHPAAAPAPDASQRAADAADGMEAALAGLRPAWIETLRLRHVEDLSYAEIAARTGVAVGTVMSRLHRAHHAVRSSTG